MKSLRKLILVAFVVSVAQSIPWRSLAASESAASPGDSLPSFAEPALSPDRSEIAFVSGGDIWTVPASGGEARLLVSHPATESRPLYSPDGRRLAFISNRTGGGDIYVLTFESGDLKRLSFDDGNDQLDGWSRDGRWIYFTSSSRDISGMNDLFRVSAEGGTPMQVSADRYASEFFAAPSPDGKTVAFTARGIAASQWWRKGHSHLDECEIWLMRDASPPAYERVTVGSAKEMWPMWSADGASIFYVSDRSGAQNIWTKSLAGPPRQVTKFKDGRVLWPNISYDGKAIVFERNFAIWKLDTASGQASEVPITRRGAPSGPAVEHLRLTDQIQELALSPDGKKVAFAVRGEVFAASSKDGGDAARVTNSPSDESQIAWAPDSRRLAHVSDRDGAPHVFLYDFASSKETQLTSGAAGDVAPTFSPDGKSLAFERDARELRVIDLDSKQERLLASGIFARPPIAANRPFVFSPDSKWIAFTSTSGKSFTNVSVVAVAGGEATQISFLANVFNSSISWSHDGAYILFDTAQRTEGGQVARIDLIPRTPRFREDQFRDLFKEESPRTTRTTQPAQDNRDTETQNAPAAQSNASEKKQPPKPVEIVLNDIKQRLSVLPVGVDPGYQEISPDGKWLLMIASAAGQQNLYTYSLDELAREPAVARQLTSTAGSKRDAQFSPDSKEVFFIEQGRINVVPLESRTPRALAVTAEMDVDFAHEKLEVFNQAWTYLRDNFYDPNLNGVDWGAVRAEYSPHIAGARTPDEMRRLMSLMVGELNASHSGVSAPFTPNQSTTGKLGLRFDRAEYEGSGRLRVSEVIPLGPAAIAGVKQGDYLLAVDGTRIDARVNLDELLGYKINKRVSLTVSASRDDANKREIVARPVNTQTEKGLLYREWVAEKREYVAKFSGGRLGYVHMFDMGSGSLSQLFVDLDTENQSREGVVVDVRNNNGGFVNAYAIDVFARQGYMTMTRRGFPSAPARTVLGQRALEAPTILVTNQHSLSDAEDFTEGYRALKLGKVVGEPTGGWIIYTSNVTLVDGTSLRLPFIKITSSDGRLMEMSPRPVDVPVVRPIGESYSGHDVQLETAVRELLKQIGDNRH
jgi:tricorn protease